jgi:hypothetical protein
MTHPACASPARVDAAAGPRVPRGAGPERHVG